MLALARRTIVRVGLWCPLLFLEAGRSFILTPIERASDHGEGRRVGGGGGRNIPFYFYFYFSEESPCVYAGGPHPASLQLGAFFLK
jgi:hypothetical protein